MTIQWDRLSQLRLVFKVSTHSNPKASPLPVRGPRPAPSAQPRPPARLLPRCRAPRLPRHHAVGALHRRPRLCRPAARTHRIPGVPSDRRHAYMGPDCLCARLPGLLPYCFVPVYMHGFSLVTGHRFATHPRTPARVIDAGHCKAPPPRLAGRIAAQRLAVWRRGGRQRRRGDCGGACGVCGPGRALLGARPSQQVRQDLTATSVSSWVNQSLFYNEPVIPCTAQARRAPSNVTSRPISPPLPNMQTRL
jgi:hypothetical protein